MKGENKVLMKKMNIYKDNLEIKNKRNYGIDLLRIISMLYVILLHSLGQGGLLENTIVNSIQYKFVWLIEICAYGAVDIFAIISGYVSYNEKEKKFKISNYINLWLQVVFYDLLLTIIFNIVMPNLVSREDYIIAFLPVTNKLYWYFTAYTGLFIIMPIINSGIRNCNDVILKRIFFLIIIVFSFLDNISGRFNLNDGYSFIWITLLFILGSIIKKCKIGKNMKIHTILLIIVLLYSITYMYKIYGFEFSILDISINKNLFVSYLSPTILLVSIFHVILFSRLEIKLLGTKIIKFMASSAFAVYLLNTNKFVFNNVMKGLFTNLYNQSLIKIFVYVFSFSILFVLASIIIDKIRMILFKICKLNVLLDKLGNKFNEQN